MYMFISPHYWCVITPHSGRAITALVLIENIWQCKNAHNKMWPISLPWDTLRLRRASLAARRTIGCASLSNCSNTNRWSVITWLGRLGAPSTTGEWPVCPRQLEAQSTHEETISRISALTTAFRAVTNGDASARWCPSKIPLKVEWAGWVRWSCGLEIECRCALIMNLTMNSRRKRFSNSDSPSPDHTSILLLSTSVGAWQCEEASSWPQVDRSARSTNRRVGLADLPASVPKSAWSAAAMMPRRISERTNLIDHTKNTNKWSKKYRNLPTQGHLSAPDPRDDALTYNAEGHQCEQAGFCRTSLVKCCGTENGSAPLGGSEGEIWAKSITHTRPTVRHSRRRDEMDSGSTKSSKRFTVVDCRSCLVQAGVTDDTLGRAQI